MYRTKLLTLIAVLGVLLSACDTSADESRPVLPGTVVGVVDGDTVDVRLASGVIRVRLHAIDTPERGQPYYADAKQALSALVYGKPVQVEPFEQDRYDRLVGRLWVGGQDINAWMIKLGHAWAYRSYLDDAAYCRHEFSARQQRLGLWQLPAGERVAPWEWRKRKTLEGRYTDYERAGLAGCIAAMGK